MNYYLGTYLILEKIHEQARERGDIEFANFINDNIQPFWSAIPLDIRKALKSPSTRDRWTASVGWNDNEVTVAANAVVSLLSRKEETKT